MNALDEAKRYLTSYEDYAEMRANNPDRFSVDPETYPAVALAYAAIAQVQAIEAQTAQLARIADALERYIGPATPIDPELEDYRRNCIPGESIDEYRQRVSEGEHNEALEEYKWFKKNSGLN